MGNYYCKKCGVCIDYYNDQNIGRASCRVATKEDLLRGCRGNCHHDFRFLYWGSIIFGSCRA